MQKLLLSAISAKNYTPMRANDLAYLLSIPKTAQKDMYKALDALAADNKISRDERGNYSRTTSRPSYSSGEQNGESPDTNFHQYGGRERRKDGDDRRCGSASNKPQPRSLTTAEVKEAESRPGGDLTEILMEYDIPLEFPQKVLNQASRLPDNPTENDMTGRLDLRGKTIITIDGDDSRDFDDAVSLEKSGSEYILGVHIADVSHYVPAGSALDTEALKRGTSVYIPDRVVPMLPEKLSNGICSLNEGVDRLTLSCIVRLDREGAILDSKICESVICSAHRMTYSKVDRILSHDAALTAEYSDIVPMLFDMNELAEKLTARRKKRGMIDFDFPETKFELDESRKPVRIYGSRPTAATKLIEQFMLTANEVVARTYSQKGLPFIYRIHEHPDDDKIEDTLTAVRAMGFEAGKKGLHITPLEVQKIISDVTGKPEDAMVSSMLLRSMSQARYSTKNAGHFGLAAGYYCHFTSPIRRYPDLQIHRIIKDDLNGRLNERKTSWYRRNLDDVAWKTSALERRAVEVEREADKVKMAEYVLDHIGETTDAVVTGVTGWGIYVQRPDTIEGLVHISRIHGDYYDFDEKSMTLKGKRTGRTFSLGDHLRVKTISADVERRVIDFDLAEEGDKDGTEEDKQTDSQQ